MVDAGTVTALLPSSSLPQKIKTWVKMPSVTCPSTTSDKQGSGPT